mmetsp:Transcript_105170/g.255316  ORF Transcript_105170/g.255316 Transcript_105170/m.255316 type:complete len:242 (-) Transcript_105170:751-1476(-)
MHVSPRLWHRRLPSFREARGCAAPRRSRHHLGAVHSLLCYFHGIRRSIPHWIGPKGTKHSNGDLFGCWHHLGPWCGVAICHPLPSPKEVRRHPSFRADDHCHKCGILDLGRTVPGVFQRNRRVVAVGPWWVGAACTVLHTFRAVLLVGLPFVQLSQPQGGSGAAVNTSVPWRNRTGGSAAWVHDRLVGRRHRSSRCAHGDDLQILPAAWRHAAGASPPVPSTLLEVACFPFQEAGQCDAPL